MISLVEVGACLVRREGQIGGESGQEAFEIPGNDNRTSIRDLDDLERENQVETIRAS